MAVTVTEFQEKVYLLLLQIPSGKITSYLAISRALSTSPRAVGGALRCNPYAPRVPCHRVIAASGYIGGFKGDWEKAPSGINQSMKRDLLKEEGVLFTDDGKLIGGEEVWFDGPWDFQGKSSGSRKAFDKAQEDAKSITAKQIKGGRLK